jgi:hypothetical protein
MANDLDDLDEAEGDPQPSQGRELVIVDLGHTTMMPGSACEAEWARKTSKPIGVTIKEANAPTATGPAGRSVRPLH